MLIVDSEAPLGEVLGGTYRITHLLGRGGMGAVYEAEHLRLPRRFAVKFLRAESLRTQDVFARFRREAEIASSLGHDNIAEVVDFNDAGDAPYIVMELLQGEELATRLARVGQLDLDSAWTILDQTASALEAAHESHVVHRDLKPQNIFLCRTRERDDAVKVMDFGICKIVDTESVATQAGTVLGTAHYMAPEQAEGHNDIVDARTDVFALGAIAYEMLTGRRAFDGGRASATLYQVCQIEPAPISMFRPELPAAVADVVHKAMAKRPEARFPSMAALRDALREACDRPVVHRTGTSRALSVVPGASAPETTFGGTAAESVLRKTRARRAWKSAIGLAAVAASVAAWALLSGAPSRLAPTPSLPAVAVRESSPPPPAPPRPAEPESPWATTPTAPDEVTITVESIPSGAAVHRDGSAVGRTPYRFRTVRSDKGFKVDVRLPGFYSATRAVAPNKDRRIEVPLIRVPQQ